MSESPGTPLRDRPPDPKRITRLLSDAGWRIVGQRHDAYVRMAPPGESRASVLVPLDRSAPEFAVVMEEALNDIQRMSIRDAGASYVTALLMADPTDGFRFKVENPGPRGLIRWAQGERLIQSSRLVLAAGAKSYMDRLSYFGNRFGRFANRYLDTVLMGQTAPGSYVVSAFVPSAGFVPLTSSATPGSDLGEELAPGETDAAPTRAIGISTWGAALATAEAIAHCTDTGSLSAFEALVPRGVSHEMAVAMRGLVEGSDGAELTVEWDPAIPIPKDLQTTHIDLRPADSAVLARASVDLVGKIAKAAQPRPIVITGRVHLLTRKEAEGPGVVGVENLLRGEPRRVRVRLDDEGYHYALRAHDEGLAIIVEGMIEREGNVYWMYQGHLVNVLGPVDETKAMLSNGS